METFINLSWVAHPMLRCQQHQAFLGRCALCSFVLDPTRWHVHRGFRVWYGMNIYIYIYIYFSIDFYWFLYISIDFCLNDRSWGFWGAHNQDCWDTKALMEAGHGTLLERSGKWRAPFCGFIGGIPTAGSCCVKMIRNHWIWNALT